MCCKTRKLVNQASYDHNYLTRSISVELPRLIVAQVKKANTACDALPPPVALAA